jgi:hypothetical protein
VQGQNFPSCITIQIRAPVLSSFVLWRKINEMGHPTDQQLDTLLLLLSILKMHKYEYYLFKIKIRNLEN